MTAISSVPLEIMNPALQEEEYFDTLEKSRVPLEKFLNILGYLPPTCFIGGGVRIVMGIVDTIKFLSKSIFCIIADLFAKAPRGYGYRSMRYMNIAFHASNNVLRGMFEFLPFILNNAMLFCYDYFLDGRFKYPVERKPGYTDVFTL